MKTKNKIIIGIIFAILFAIVIVLVKTVDIASIGPEGTSIGLSTVNKAVNEASGENMTLYKIAEYLGYAALLLCVFFAAIGLLQIIRRRGILKADRTIYALGGLYIVTIGLYVIFEKIVVNYRPMIMPGDEHVEASFPSSHTVLAIVVMGSAIILAKYYIKNASLRRALQILCAVVLATTVIFRLWSGVHWLTDIIGGTLIAVSLLFLWSALFDVTAEKDGLIEAHRHDR